MDYFPSKIKSKIIKQKLPLSFIQEQFTDGGTGGGNPKWKPLTKGMIKKLPMKYTN